jgi:hypothetical protein
MDLTLSSNFKSDPPICRIASTNELNSWPPGIPVKVIPVSTSFKNKVKESGLLCLDPKSKSSRYNFFETLQTSLKNFRNSSLFS